MIKNFNDFINEGGLWDNIRKKRERLGVKKIGSKTSTFKSKKEFEKVAKEVSESLVTQSKEKEVFDYHSVVNDMWRPLIKQAQEFQKINFDLENNESTKEKKILYIKKNLRKDQPVKYQFNIELFEAGGDWECSVMYFKVQIIHDYFYGNKKFKDNPKYIFDIEPKETPKLRKSYVIIPDNETGGNHYVKTEKGFTAYTDESLKAEGLKNWKDVKNDHAKAWKWIENLLTKAVDERHEMLDEPSNSEPKDISESRKLESMTEIRISSTNEKLEPPGLNAHVTFASPNGPTHLTYTKYNEGTEQFCVSISSNKCSSIIDNIPKKYRKDFEMLRSYLKEKKPYLWSEKLNNLNNKTGILN